MEQLQVVTLKCANCAASLQIGARVDQLACGYCGSHQQVVRQGGAISLEKFADSLESVGRSADRAAAEMAIPRLERELCELQEQRQQAEAQGGYEVAELRAEFKRYLGGALVLPACLGMILGAYFEAFMIGALIGGACSVFCAAAIFVFVRPQRLEKESAVGSRVWGEVEATDSRIRQTQRAIAGNRRGANSQTGGALSQLPRPSLSGGCLRRVLYRMTRCTSERAEGKYRRRRGVRQVARLNASAYDGCVFSALYETPTAHSKPIADD